MPWKFVAWLSFGIFVAVLAVAPNADTGSRDIGGTDQSSNAQSRGHDQIYHEMNSSRSMDCCRKDRSLQQICSAHPR